MTDYESTWDQCLGIQTAGRDDTRSDQYRYPYEPTPYAVLERLAQSGLIGQRNTVLDYGCGKGRADFFLNQQTGATAVGIEYDERIYEAALKNQKTAHAKADFVCMKAEAYPVPPQVDRCYFFNPFSVEIFRKVMARLLESWYDCPRQILLFFYYPSDEYVSFLMTVDELEFYDEIECGDLFNGEDSREQLLIFELPALEA